MPPTKDKKKLRWTRLTVGAICLFLLLSSLFIIRFQPPRAVQSVQVLTSDWDPYVNTTEEDGGAVGEIVLSVLAGSGFSGQVAFDTWDSGLSQVEQGTAFGIFPMVKSADRDEKFEYSEPLVDYTYVLFKRADEKTPLRILEGDLKGVRVGKIEGYDYWPELETSGAVFETYPSTVDGFKALENNEIDLLAESDLVGNATLKSSRFDGDAGLFDIIRGDEPELSSKDSVYFLIRKNKLSRSVMDDFNRALEEYKKTERYRDQVAALTGIDDKVTLVGDGLVEVSDAAGERLGSVPVGIEAVVMHWPEKLEAGEMLKIKMINGPMSGRIAYVALNNVEVEGV